jgi:hypothetical protein
MVRMEGRLINTRRTEEFNKQFEDPVDHQEREGGVQGPCELHHQGGNVKEGTISHDPLKNLHEESMRQPLPAGVSLYDCFLNGHPPKQTCVL